jgi:hypothetical protein
MSDDADPTRSVEFRVLQAMKRVLTDVIKDTTTPPGMKHPLSDGTIENIRQCLKLISAREGELADAAGKPRHLRPHYADEPQTSTVVSIKNIGRPAKKDDGE